MFNKKKPNAEAIRNLKKLLAKKFKLTENTILNVAELNCHEPDCPPTETVITARKKDKLTKIWRVHKPIEEILESDINSLD